MHAHIIKQPAHHPFPFLFFFFFAGTQLRPLFCTLPTCINHASDRYVLSAAPWNQATCMTSHCRLSYPYDSHAKHSMQRLDVWARAERYRKGGDLTKKGGITGKEAVNEKKREKRRKGGSQKGGLFPLSRTGVGETIQTLSWGLKVQKLFFLYTKEGRVFFLPKAFSFMLCMGEVFVLCMGVDVEKRARRKHKSEPSFVTLGERRGP